MYQKYWNNRITFGVPFCLSDFGFDLDFQGYFKVKYNFLNGTHDYGNQRSGIFFHSDLSLSDPPFDLVTRTNYKNLLLLDS